MKAVAALFLSLLVIMINPGCASWGSGGPELSARTFNIDSDYGSIAFSGVVHRKPTKDGYLFHIEPLQLTFVPDGRFNKVSRAELQFISIVVTRKSKVEWKPSEFLFGDRIYFTASLDNENPTVKLANAKFLVPKHIMKRADEIKLLVSDGRRLWPIVVSPNLTEP